ncbi:ATP-binding protein [Rhodococcus qingshengii]|uniref:HD domain-containing protein n=1 Tax=Rhodococcus qingshengii TaxID=334542 RepID=UPI001E58EE0C|nr:ATP-binding protein [Rhodococcus qingshengii]MCD2135887.1 ATP-binding protein [Rhodococcus qingshengii]
MTYTDSSAWKRTLAEQENDPYQDARDRLRSGFEQFRRRVEPLAGEIALSVPGYTDHSLLHCDSLWDITDVVAGVDYPLTPAEAFCLGGAFLIHDLGMGLAAHEQGISGILDDPEWLDLLAALYPDDFYELHDIAINDSGIDPTWNGLTNPRVKRALTTFLRDHHAIQAERIVTQQWKLTNKETFFLLEDSELRSWYGQLIGRLGRSHWQDIEILPKIFEQSLGAAPKLPPEWTVDPLKIAGILRCADAAQVDARRADPLHTPFRAPQGESLNHWLFQERMLYPQLQADRIAYTSSTRFSADQASAWWLAYDTAQMISNELIQVDALFADLGKPRFAAKSVAGVQAPLRFSRYVPTDGWVPIDARPKISNTGSVIETLGGHALYGLHRGDVVLRELLANAVDATRLRRAGYSESHINPIRLSISGDIDDQKLEIRDSGIGMTADEMVMYLCDFGNSGWRSQTTRENHPGALSTGFQSTGRFGIGFYSAFMISDQVTVTTRAAHLGPADTMILQFSDGLRARPLMRPAERKEWLMEPGTKIEMQLHEDWDARDSSGVRRRYPLPEDLALGIQKLALLVDESIELLSGDGSKNVCISEKRWFELTKGELFDQLVGAKNSNSDDIVSDARSVFEHRVRPLFDESGTIRGMLCLVLRDELRVYGQQSSEVPGSIYCGGFYGDDIENVAGVLEGEPMTAARESAWPVVSDDEFRRWFEEQFDILNDENLNETDRIRLAAWSLSLDRPLDNEPLIVHRTGSMTPLDFEKWASDNDMFGILQNITESVYVDNEERVHFDYSQHALHKLPDGVFGSPAQQDLGISLFLRYEIDWKLDIDTSRGNMPFGDLQTWWFYNHQSVTGELVRRAAKSWGVTIEEVLLNAEWGSNDPGDSGIFEMETIEGIKFKQKGVRFVRPQVAGPV